MIRKIPTLLLCAVLLFTGLQASAITITRVEPQNWWVGMKNKELQIMVYGPGISRSALTINYPGISIKEVAKTDNPNYLFVYMIIGSGTKPGTVPLHFKQGSDNFTYNYPLKARTDRSGAGGFNAADVLYLITPDRFANGNTANDDLDTVKVNRQNPNARHSGDLEGVKQHLNYIKDLGITTVWLNPIQENRMRGGSYHGYSITDFYQCDPRFGSNEDFRVLTKTAHDMGLKMVMDMVFNHCGSGHWWMNDLPAKDWINNDNKFMQTNHATVSVMDVHAAPSERRTFLEGWFSRQMPDLNQRNRHLATYLIQNSIWWIEYTRIDGIRQDTYSYMDFDFLSRWNKEVNDEYPDFNIVGETWYNKSTSSAWWQKGSVLDNKKSYLKTPMDFSLTFIAQNNSFAADTDNGYLNTIFEDIASDFIYPDPYHILTFLDNHDISRFTRVDDTGLLHYKQGLAFLLTTRGIPQIYYGTELLMTGTKKDGDGSIRKDVPGGWPGDTHDEFTRAGRSPIQNEAWDYMQRLLQWRKTSIAVKEGKLIHYAPRKNIYVYGRVKDDHTVMVLLNSSPKSETIKTDRFTDLTTGYTTARDVITGQSVSITDSITVPAKGEYVLELGK
jgi:glycosidase